MSKGSTGPLPRFSGMEMIVRNARLFAAIVMLSSLPAMAQETAPLLKGSEITVNGVLEQINYYRGIHGLAPFRLDERLSQAAGDRIADMEDQGYWGHISPTGMRPFVWMEPRGYHYVAAGENLACGFDTPQLLVASWMESPGHRANILSPIFQDIGIAIIEGATTGRATGRSVVTMFGSEDVSRLPPVTAARTTGH